MATRPGFLTDWPWKKLGSFKYVILSPWVIHSIYGLATKERSEIDYLNITLIPFLLWRALHNQIWISFSRHRTAKGKNRIVDKSIEFEQVDRETNWDDQILLNGLLFYFFNTTLDRASKLPIWRTEGVIATMLLHAGPVEYLYYWLHRALHHHYLYSRYHSHHHSSIVTEPISSVIHPFAEHVAYFLLFAIPMLTTVVTDTASAASLFGYITYIDLMNNMGHCNFELIPKRLFSIFPPLKYLTYTPSRVILFPKWDHELASFAFVSRFSSSGLVVMSCLSLRQFMPILFHSLHHTQFRTNYSLFMPIYDYIYGTMDKSSDELHETSLGRKEDIPDVVHLTHLTTPESIFHLQIGFASFASKPHNSKWYMWWLMWPITWWSVVLNLICGCSFIVERNSLEKLRLQLWAIPRYNVQYLAKWKNEAINGLIEEAILEAEARGAKVLSLGLLNQGEELNRNGAIYIEKHPQLNIKVVDGSSLVVAIVLNSIPKGTKEVLFRGKLSKVAYSIVVALCQKGIQVSALSENEYEELKLVVKSQCKVVISKSYTQKIWLVGDELTEEEQMRAPKGTLFVPFSKFPPKKARNDAYYHYTPAMVAPPSLENLHSCENWLPRKVMSASRVAGIVHALEGWNVNECGETLFDIDKIWQASLKNGFRPLKFSA